MAFFRLCHDRPDHVIGFLDRGGIGRRDLDHAVIVDVNFGTGQFHNLADNLAARADHFADFIGWNLQRFDLGRVFAKALRGRQRFVHFTQDMQAAIAGLSQSLGHNLGRDACDLDVHLHRGDAVGGACNLEIHIAKVIFVAQDIGQNGIAAIVFQDQTHRDASHR